MDQAQRRQEHQVRPLTDRGLKRFAYTYDFGDNWEHTLTIEAIGDADPGLDYPRFLDGARRAPPEDVGGIPGFEEFVEAMAKPRHPERKRLIEWFGRVFEPEDIDLCKTARSLTPDPHPSLTPSKLR
ncbi:MAG TPA: plasmid pRiA4b ORF-3 family protein [Bosea sp. (in: a-proteobacteria)]